MLNSFPMVKKVGTDSTKPYSFSWNSTGMAGGAQVTLTARATDASGNVSDNSITVVMAATDSSPPVVTTPSSLSKEATGSLTSVNIGQASAVDDVDGAVTVTASDDGPFAVGVHRFLRQWWLHGRCQGWCRPPVAIDGVVVGVWVGVSGQEIKILTSIVISVSS